MEVRTGRLVNEQSPGLFAQHTDRFIVDDDDMDSHTVEESADMSLKSRSFLHRVHDRVRKRQKQSSIDAIFQRCNTRQEQTFFNVVNAYVFNITSICFHGKEYSDNLRSINNTGNNLTMKQMFDTSEKLTVGQSDEIYGVNPINW